MAAKGFRSTDSRRCKLALRLQPKVLLIMNVIVTLIENVLGQL